MAFCLGNSQKAPKEVNIELGVEAQVRRSSNCRSYIEGRESIPGKRKTTDKDTVA